jgi:Protein of unknown function (DUF1553)/Protein of unknown function (DUF1549)/Planctomycete cytochrome C
MISRQLAIVTLLASGAPALFAAATAEPTKEQAAFFENKIRPILSENCYKCHSLEKGKSKGGLTLDTREGLLKGGEDGPAVKAGEPTDSPLIKAVRYQDKDLQMPPSKDGGGKLSDADIATLTEWVKMGAPDPRKDAPATGKMTGLTEKARQHWAYQPVKNPAPPTVKNSAWGRTPVDAFIMAKLDEKGMKPAADTTKENLLRRATYDLTGLPPTPEEIKAFLADTTPQAFATVVDRLMATPAYGERWGRFWLDTSRYADTVGGDKNAARRGDYRYAYAWTYRDYVIRAFNEDKPYNQFILEQLAADQLPEIKPTDERMAALGFLTVGERFANVNDVINDRIDTVAKGFLGLTVACARCHDHKFDPIPTSDYYALHGIFASTLEPANKPVISELSPNYEEFQKQLTDLENQDRAIYYRVIGQETARFRTAPTAYFAAGSVRKGKKQTASEEDLKKRLQLIAQYKLDTDLLQEIGRRARTGGNSIFAPYLMFAELDPAAFAAKAPEVLANIAAGNMGDFVIHTGAGRKAGALGKGGFGYGKRGSAIDEPEPTGMNPLVVAAFKDAHPQSMQDVEAIYAQLFASCEPQAQAYLKACSEAKSLPVEGFDPALVQLLEFPFGIEAGGALTTDHLRELVNLWPQKFNYRSGFVFARINELLLTNPAAPARAMIVADAPTPHDSPVFIRGQAETRGDIVPRHFLEVLSSGTPQPFTQGSGRLELAKCIASPSNPLTARVLVNRVWMHHFGEGFVPTLDDLGTQSEPPSHPELLDYLATYFMENGWSIKKLHRLIMLSRVYQESSDTNPAYERIDSRNRFLWRANIRRLDFEAVRDSLLVFSGKLDRTVGGQPVNLTEEPYSYRRSVYGYIDRGNLPELMQTFDFSDPDMPNSRRATTVVPQQALFLMNSAMSVDVARRIVARPEVIAADDDLGKVFAIYHVIFQRNPKPMEIQLALQFVGNEAKNQPQVAPIAASKSAMRLTARKGGAKGYGEAAKPIQNQGEIVERKPLTPWETYAQALLFSNEASYIN